MAATGAQQQWNRMASAETIAYICSAHYLGCSDARERERSAALAGAIGEEIMGSSSEFLQRVITLCSEAVAAAEAKNAHDELPTEPR